MRSSCVAAAPRVPDVPVAALPAASIVPVISMRLPTCCASSASRLPESV
jgi:hypothetical protein